VARRTIVSAFALASLLAGPVILHEARAQAVDAPAQKDGARQDAAPAKPQDQADAPPKPVTTTDPNLAVATVRLEGGYRASKVIGAAVYNAQNQQIGTVDDIILNHQNQADLVVISVGGVLGVGSKLVALPFAKIERTDSAKVMLQDGTKDTLMKLPNFTYTP
jgi:sporulation protein YlmC with PRC-barrel domain